MKIRQAPVADLLKYLEGLYNDRPKSFRTSNILNVINKYYCSITNHKTIMPVGGDVMNDWCDLNHSSNMSTCPNVPGILVYKKKIDGSYSYGLLYHSGYITTANKQTNFLSYYYAHPEGHIGSHSFHIDDWDGWGAPIRYFSFPSEDYIDSRFWGLGERCLKLGSIGHDVRQLQAFLVKAEPNVPLHGVFEENTLEALHNVQSWCGLPKIDSFDLSQDGQKIIDFLVGNK